MKKIITSAFVLLLAVCMTQSTQAQRDFVYDGDTFNVWLKVNSANTQVLEVHFSDKGKWNLFSVEDYQDFGNETEQAGFAFKVKDGVGNLYWVDYFTDEDYIVVSSEDGTGSWTLNRRK